MPPAKDFGEKFDRTKKSFLNFVTKQGENISEQVEKIDKKVEEKTGWKDKIGGLLRRKSKLEEEGKNE